MPASSIARSKQLARRADEGPPGVSSWSPGCSPTNITSAFFEPSPKTAWVAFL